ncbi:MAG: toll/interleukin-1 receptor domain-containing protein [Elusimicrobiales bacterium]|nr:toll/interleukin-1 receptor domain-containing protein [Elusimicrobiales bacterium]
MSKVFISHVSEDHKFIERLTKKLEKEKVEFWVDDLELKPGDSIVEKIEEGLKDSDIYLLVISDNSINKPWFKKEMSVALIKKINDKKVLIIPILLDFDPNHLPELLRDIYCLRFSRYDWNNEVFKLLVNVIKDHFRKKELYNSQDKFIENAFYIDHMINKKNVNITPKELGFLLDLIKEGKYLNYFFRKAKNPEWLKVLVNEGFLSPEQFPSPEENKEQKGYFYFPHWPALDYLERVSEKLKDLNEKDRNEYIEILLKIISGVMDYHIKNNKRLDNFRIWTSFVKILSNIPNKKIEKDKLESFIKTSLDSNFSVEMQFIEIGEKLLPKFLKSGNVRDIEKAELIIKHLTQIKWYPKYSEKQREKFEENEESPKLLAGEYWFYKIFNENRELIAERVSDDTVLIFVDRLVEIFEKRYKVKFDYSNIWIRAIKDEADPDEVETAIALVLRDVLKIRASKIDITPIIDKLTSGEYFDYSFFKRLIIFLIAESFEKLKNIFKPLLEKEGELYFNDITYEPELYYLLQKNSNKLSEFSDVIVDIIENKVPERDIEIENEVRKEKIISNVRLKWYSALKDNNVFKEYYDKYLEKVGEEPKPYFTMPRTYVGPGPSPLTKEEILNMEGTELVDYIKNFKLQTKLSFGEKPTARGFAEMIKVSAKEKPEKFIKNFKEYAEMPFFYFADILWGVYDVLSKNKIEVDNIKIFISNISEYFKTDKFWNDKYYLKPNNFDIYHADHLSIISIVFVIFNKIIEQENIKKDITIISLIWDITINVIDKITERKEIKKYNDEDDWYLTNSTLANIIRVLINLLYLQKMSSNIGEIIKIFNNSFNSLLNNQCIESVFWFGAKFPFLYSVNKEWTQKTIEFIRIDNKKWEIFMLGYTWNNRFDYDSYRFLKEDYEKALEYNFKQGDDRIKSFLVQNICYSYLSKKENLGDNNSLFSKLLEEWDYKYIEEIIDFFWRHRDKKNEEISGRIIDFWRLIFKNKCEYPETLINVYNLLSDYDKKILSELSKLAVFLDEINEENSKWLKMSARFIDYINSSFFIEYLNKIKDKGESYKYLTEIFKEILNLTTPFYKKEDIRSIIEFLYQKSMGLEDKKLAVEIADNIDEIINTYEERGYEFLHDLYEKYHKDN